MQFCGQLVTHVLRDKVERYFTANQIKPSYDHGVSVSFLHFHPFSVYLFFYPLTYLDTVSSKRERVQIENTSSSITVKDKLLRIPILINGALFLSQLLERSIHGRNCHYCTCTPVYLYHQLKEVGCTLLRQIRRRLKSQ